MATAVQSGDMIEISARTYIMIGTGVQVVTTIETNIQTGDKEITTRTRKMIEAGE